MLLAEELECLLYDPVTGVARRNSAADRALFNGATIADLLDTGSVVLVEEYGRASTIPKVFVEVAGNPPDSALLLQLHHELLSERKRRTLDWLLGRFVPGVDEVWRIRGWMAPESRRSTDALTAQGIVSVAAVHEHWSRLMARTAQHTERDARIIQLARAGEWRVWEAMFLPLSPGREEAHKRLDEIGGTWSSDSVVAEYLQFLENDSRGIRTALSPFERVCEAISLRTSR
jgi:hypothetical protein